LSQASNADDINALIKSEINTVNTAKELTEAQKLCKVKLERELNILKKQMR